MKRISFAVALFLFALHALASAQESGALAAYSAALATKAEVPPFRELLNSLLDHQSELDARKKDYIFNKTVEEQQLQDDGTVRPLSTTEYESFYIGQIEIERVVSRNGKPPARRPAAEKRAGARRGAGPQSKGVHAEVRRPLQGREG